jgi:Flp pilus assembly protein TadD
MSIVTAIVFSMFLLIVTGCATASDPSAAKPAAGKKDSPVKPTKHDEKRSMNEESMNAVQ